MSDIGLSDDVSTADAAAAGLGGAQTDDTDTEEAYSSIAYGKTPQETFNDIMGITDTNPFGYKGFFTDLFGINPKSIDYSDIFSDDEREALVNQQFGLAVNPQNQPGFGYNPNVPTVTTGVREGLTRGFGSLFGSPVGISTFQGPVAAQRSKDPMDALALGAFSALGPMSLPSLAAQAIGRDTYTTKGAPDYNPALDPNSPSFTGPTSLGGIADAISVLGTGMTTTTAQEAYEAAKGAIEEAVKDFSIDPFDGLKDEDFTGMLSGRDDKSSGSMQISDMTQQGANMEDTKEEKEVGDINKGIGGLGSNMMMADASSFVNPRSLSGALNYFAGPQIQDYFRDLTGKPDATIQLGPRFDVEKQKVDDNILSVNIPFNIG